MSYAVKLAEQANEKLAALNLPRHILDKIEEALDHLADDPVRHSRPSRFPYVKGQAFDFHWKSGPGKGTCIRFHFMYGTDEQSLLVFDITSEDYLLL